jgi:ABC-type spermidine/putrescine transport system permease subunit II
VPLRDYGSAYALWRSLLFAVGAEIGGVVIGVTLAVGGWAFGKRLSTTGAGIGIAVQSAVLLVLDLIFLHGINL